MMRAEPRMDAPSVILAARDMTQMMPVRRPCVRLARRKGQRCGWPDGCGSDAQGAAAGATKRLRKR